MNDASPDDDRLNFHRQQGVVRSPQFHQCVVLPAHKCILSTQHMHRLVAMLRIHVIVIEYIPIIIHRSPRLRCHALPHREHCVYIRIDTIQVSHAQPSILSNAMRPINFPLIGIFTSSANSMWPSSWYYVWIYISNGRFRTQLPFYEVWALLLCLWRNLAL